MLCHLGNRCPYELTRFLRHHEIICRARLRQDSLRGYIVVAGVASVVPVLYHSAPHCASFPPVVRSREEARFFSGLVAGVVGHHTICNGTGGGPDGLCGGSD